MRAGGERRFIEPYLVNHSTFFVLPPLSAADHRCEKATYSDSPPLLHTSRRMNLLRANSTLKGGPLVLTRGPYQYLHSYPFVFLFSLRTRLVVVKSGLELAG